MAKDQSTQTAKPATGPDKFYDPVEVVRVAANRIAVPGPPIEEREALCKKMRRIQIYLLDKLAGDRSWGRTK